MKPTLIRITTVPISLQKLISGQMKFMSSNGFKVWMVSSDFDQKCELESDERSKFIVVNMTRIISPISDLISLYKLIKLFRKLKPQIVHTHTPKAGVIGMLAARISMVPVRLHTVAGLPLMEEKGIKRSILEEVEILTYRCATMVYPNSNNLRNFIIKHGFCDASKLKVIGNGSSNGINVNEFIRKPEVDLEAKRISSRHGINEDDFVFVFVGRLVKDKGIEELVAAFSLLSVKFDKLKLLLVGPEEQKLDPLSESCRAEILENPSIFHVGYQSDVKPYLSLSSALVFPSYREGFPNVPMQAGCFDLPSIVTDINGCNEIITEGENGLIVPVKDSGALQAAMEKLYLDKDLYVKMARNAREMIVTKFDQKKVWSLILTEYRQHLKDKGLVYADI